MVKPNTESPTVYLKALEIALTTQICRNDTHYGCNETECASRKCIGWHIKEAKKQMGIK